MALYKNTRALKLFRTRDYFYHHKNNLIFNAKNASLLIFAQKPSSTAHP
jgi:hypothetical protein